MTSSNKAFCCCCNGINHYDDDDHCHHHQMMINFFYWNVFSLSLSLSFFIHSIWKKKNKKVSMKSFRFVHQDLWWWKWFRKCSRIHHQNTNAQTKHTWVKMVRKKRSTSFMMMMMIRRVYVTHRLILVLGLYFLLLQLLFCQVSLLLAFHSINPFYA